MNTRHMLFIFLALTVGILIAMLILPGQVERKKKVAPSSPPQACTLEAKLCPDGSSVGRTGPNCEFAPCPGE